MRLFDEILNNIRNYTGEELAEKNSLKNICATCTFCLQFYDIFSKISS